MGPGLIEKCGRADRRLTLCEAGGRIGIGMSMLLPATVPGGHSQAELMSVIRG